METGPGPSPKSQVASSAWAQSAPPGSLGRFLIAPCVASVSWASSFLLPCRSQEGHAVPGPDLGLEVTGSVEGRGLAQPTPLSSPRHPALWYIPPVLVSAGLLLPCWVPSLGALGIVHPSKRLPDSPPPPA